MTPPLSLLAAGLGFFITLPFGSTSALAQPSGAAMEQKLTNVDFKVGDKAPLITDLEWLKGEPVPKFKKGKIYVIDLWATWCGPCVRTMPHLTELAEKYRDDDVVVIAINVNEEAALDAGDPDIDPDEVTARVKEFIEDNEDIMGFHVAMEDPVAKSFHQSWLLASGYKGIPTSFVIDQEGRLAWTGWPTKMEGYGPEYSLSLDDVLPDLVKGVFDREAAAKQQYYRVSLQLTLNSTVETGLCFSR